MQRGSLTIAEVQAMQVLTKDEERSQGVALRTILLATDGSAHAHYALEAAADLARRSGASLYLVTAYQLPLSAVYVSSAYVGPEVTTDPFEADAQTLLKVEERRIEALGASVSGLYTGRGAVFDVITTTAATVDADLIVVGSRELGGLKRLLVGSVSASVTHAAHRPVLIVRGGPHHWPPEHVIVGVDRSPVSKRAARIAATIARFFGDVTVELEEVIPDPPPEASRYFTFDDPVETEHEGLDQFAENLEPLAGHSVSATTASGDPAAALLARESDRPGATLIVVGARGFGAARRLLLGSVSTRLIHSGHSPLLVVPAWPEKAPEPRGAERISAMR
jgi:nucleotide-binding universal stress UspA family protein